MKIHNFLLTLAYNGANYHGSYRYIQETPTSTVEDALFKALADAGITPSPPYCFRRVSRTDTGVSAVAALFSGWLRCSAEEVCAIRLPEDIKLLSVQRAFPTFDPLRFCTGRTYLYYVPCGAVQLDLEADFLPEGVQMSAEVINMIENYYKSQAVLDRLLTLCDIFTGRHDFGSFASASEEQTKRTISQFMCTIEDGFYCFTISGNSFLKHMIRRIVASVLLCVSGKITIAQVLWLLEGRRDTVLLPRAPGRFLLLLAQEFKGFEAHAHYFALDCERQDVYEAGLAFLGRFWERQPWPGLESCTLERTWQTA